LKLKESHTILGARGWQRPDWTGTYYPDDLPPEWRLAFYANDFTGVLVPASDWRDLPLDAVAAWKDEVPEGFVFFFETDDDTPPPIELTETLGETFGGCVTDAADDRPGFLRSVNLQEASSSSAPIVLIDASALEDRRRLGKQLTALAARTPSPLALIATGRLAGEALRELRILAELVGVA